MFNHVGFGMSDLPGNRFYQTILSNLLAIDGLSGTVSAYTGASNVALYQKWKELSFNTTGTEKILRLIWTDIAANYVVGAKGRLSTSKLLEKIVDSNSSKQSTVDVPVTLNSRAVKYHIPYIIPAVIVLFFTLLIGLATFFAFLFLAAQASARHADILCRRRPGAYSARCSIRMTAIHWIR